MSIDTQSMGSAGGAGRATQVSCVEHSLTMAVRSEAENRIVVRWSHQVWLVRGLLLASLALLVAGAVTPLLTTERFYFFSNTFSLLSGLSELTANGHYVVAGVVALFSLCVPVVKATILWLATSQRATGSPLVTVADRFGKWSMLEVFIAALLIVALKLGPIAEAELHYGAYLLASSVLLSGIASQLLAGEPRAAPLFSSGVTLTIGAVLGAVAATLLIGLLNPDLLRLEALVGNAEARCVERVLRWDRVFAEASGSQAEYVGNLRAIASDGCPEEFREAFAEYVGAWQRLEAHDAGEPAEPGWLDRVGSWVGLVATRDDTLDDIEQAWDEVARAALEHGVTAPEK